MPIDVINPPEAMFPPERIPFTSYETIASPGTADLLDLTTFSSRRDEYTAWLTNIAGEQTTDLLLNVQVTHPDLRGTGGSRTQTETYNLGALPGINKPLDDLGLLGTSDLSITYNNQTGAQQSNVRTWGTLTYQIPTAIDRLVYNMSTSSVSGLVSQFNLEQREAFGDLPEAPIGTETTPMDMDRDFLGDDYQTYHGTPASGSFNTVLSFSSLGPDFQVALAGLAVTPKTGSTNPGDITMHIVRDGQQVTTMEFYSMPHLEREVPMWIPADDRIQLEVEGDGATAVDVRARRLNYKKTAIDWARWYPVETVVEKTNLSQKQAQQLAEYVRAGVQPHRPGSK